MKISSNKIMKYLERFMELDHIDRRKVVEIFTHKELRELIGILEQLLFFMYMAHKENFDI